MVLPKLEKTSGYNKIFFEWVGETARLFASVRGAPAFRVYLGTENYEIARKLHDQGNLKGKLPVKLLNLEAVLDPKLGENTVKVEDATGKLQFWGAKPDKK